MKLEILSAYNFCYECARVLISFPLDQKYEIIYENYIKSTHTCGSLKHLFLRHSVQFRYNMFNSHAWYWKSLSAYNFCYECARDLISFPLEQKYEFFNKNDPESWLWFPNTPFFLDTLYILGIIYEYLSIR